MNPMSISCHNPVSSDKRRQSHLHSPPLSVLEIRSTCMFRHNKNLVLDVKWFKNVESIIYGSAKNYVIP